MHPLAVAAAEAGVAVGKRGRGANADRTIDTAMISLCRRDQNREARNDDEPRCSTMRHGMTEHPKTPPYMSR